jgi:P-type Cu+ transporter
MRRTVLLLSCAVVAACDDGAAHHHAEGDDAEMRVTTAPSPPLAMFPAVVTVALVTPDGLPAAGLELSHERYLHTVLFANDLNGFAHVHQEDSQPVTADDLAAASFDLSHVFPASGPWLVAGDWCRDGRAGHAQTIVDVDGNAGMSAEDSDTSRTKLVDDYVVTLDFDVDLSDPVAGQPVAFTISIRTGDGGVADVTDLEPYLGAEMHLSAVKSGLALALHTHPAVDGAHAHCGPPRAQVYFGPSIPFEIEFPSPGPWKLWGEFRHAGSVHTVGFLVTVVAPSS